MTGNSHRTRGTNGISHGESVLAFAGTKLPIYQGKLLRFLRQRAAKFRVFFGIAFLMAVLPEIALAEPPGGFAGAELENPPTAIAGAFAGACFTFDPEPSSFATNPANMYNLPFTCAVASYEDYSLDVKRYSLFLQTPLRGNFRLGAGMIQHGVEDIVGRDESGAPTQNFSYLYNTYIVAGGYGISGGKIRTPCETTVWDFSVGISAKLSRQYLADTVEATGSAVDIGVSGKYLNFRYGAVIRNIVGALTPESADSSSNRYPPALIIGAGWEYCASSWFEVSVEKKVTGRFRFRVGGQFLINDWAGLRAGVDFQKGTPTPLGEWRIGFGGVIYRRLVVPLEISYSVQYIRPIGKFAFGAALSWNTF